MTKGPTATAEESDVIVAEVNRIRATLGPRRAFREPAFLAGLADELEASAVLSRQPPVRAFVQDARGFPATGTLDRTKYLVNAGVDNTIFSLFDASYFPTLSLEYLKYHRVPTDERLASAYASPTAAVRIEKRTTGFEHRVVVALFPENHLDGHQEPNDLIFYFIDKFVERHVRLTRLLVDAVLADGTFPQIRMATEDDVERASSWWVHLHEYHHHQGDMPIPEFLPWKKSKALAGLEELRTDVSSMLACLDNAELPRGEALLTYEYILAERLLRYAVEGIPRPNYDAVSSQLLFNYLMENGGISLRGDRIHLTPGLPEVLADFLGEIQAIEARVHDEPPEEVKKRLQEFTNHYTDFDEEARDYRHIPFFAEVKRRLSV